MSLRRTVLFFLVASMLIISCEKDSELYNLNSTSFDESIWNGYVTVNNVHLRAGVKMEFNSDSTGIYYLTDVSSSANNYSVNSNFFYEKKEKILFLNGGYNNIFLGDWWLEKADKNALVLTRSTENPAVSDTLKIFKTK